MFRTLHNTFISFSINFQGFQGLNPKYRGGNVKGVRWIHNLDERSIWIRINHGTLLVWILNSCCFWNHNDVTWDYTKGRVLGRRGFLDTVLGRVKGAICTL